MALSVFGSFTAIISAFGDCPPPATGTKYKPIVSWLSSVPSIFKPQPRMVIRLPCVNTSSTMPHGKRMKEIIEQRRTKH